MMKVVFKAIGGALVIVGLCILFGFYLLFYGLGISELGLFEKPAWFLGTVIFVLGAILLLIGFLVGVMTKEPNQN